MTGIHNATLEDFPQYMVGNIIWKYVTPLLIVVGTCGNVLSIIVLMRPRLRHATTMFYLICLSIDDLFSLYTGLLRYWIIEAFSIDVRFLSDASCKIHTFLVYLSLDFTVWVLVSVTIDRCLSVSLPFKAKLFCSLAKARWVICLILCLLVLINMSLLWNMGLVQTYKYQCDANSEAAFKFLKYVWPWIDFSTFCLIPFAIMIGCNIKIIHSLLASRKKIDAHKNAYVNRKNVVDTVNQTSCFEERNSGDCQPSTAMADMFKTEPTQSVKQDMTQRKKKAGNTSSLTAMLLTINCVFLLTTVPIEVFFIGEEFWFPRETVEQNAWYYFWEALVNMLQYIYNAIHFFLYCLSGPRFRNELKTMCRRSHKVANHS